MRNEPFSLRHRSFKETLVEAKRLSKLTNTEISNMSGIQEAKVARYFSLYDRYMPSPEKIPALCRALGNTLIAEWVFTQVQEMNPKMEIVSIPDLTKAVMRATENTGKLNTLAIQAAEDGILSKEEAQDLQAQLFQNGKWNFKAAEALEPVARGAVRQ